MKITSVEALSRDERVKGKRIFLFGASKLGIEVLEALKLLNIKVHGFLDNDVKKQGKHIDEIMIMGPAILQADDVVIISSMYQKEINQQLKEMGIKDVYIIDKVDGGINYAPLWKQRTNNYLQIGNGSVLTNSFKIEGDSINSRKMASIGSHSLIGCSINCYDSGYIHIGNDTYISEGTSLICKEKISIGDGVLISWGCTIYDNDGHSVSYEERRNDVRNMIECYYKHGYVTRNEHWEHVCKEEIVIKNKVWIGFGVTILKGVTIGEGAVVAAHSVVTKDVAPYTVVAGNPAIEKRKIIHNENGK